MGPRRDNAAIAQRLREAADLLRIRGADPRTVRAYRAAAQSIDSMHHDLHAIFDAGGVKALDAIPHVSLGIASAIAGMLAHGQLALPLDIPRMEARQAPLDAYQRGSRAVRYAGSEGAIR